MKRTLCGLATALLLALAAPAAHAYPCTGGGCVTAAHPCTGGDC